MLRCSETDRTHNTGPVTSLKALEGVKSPAIVGPVFGLLCPFVFISVLFSFSLYGPHVTLFI